MYKSLFHHKSILGASSLVVVLLLIYVLFESGLTMGKQAIECKQCNVILISLDTLGAKHLSVYDSSLTTTPFLQKLAKTNTAVFLNAYSQAPWTLPSHGSMLTGLYPWELGLRHALDTIGSSTILLAEKMQTAGYYTAAFSNGSFVQPYWGFKQGFMEFHSHPSEAEWNDVPEIFASSSRWISDQQPDNPFFLFIHSFHAHDPYGSGNDAISIHDIVDVNLESDIINADTATSYKLSYHEEIKEIDKALENFFDTLSKSPHAKNTIVVITSDHGEEFGEHGTAGFHSVTLHNELLHVPLLISIPGITSISHDVSVEIRSIPATIMELVTGITNAFEGQSLVPIMSKTNTANRLVLSSTYMNRDYLLDFLKPGYPESLPYIEEYLQTHPLPTEQRSAILGNIHAIKNEGGRVSVYDMKIDSTESNALTQEAIDSVPDARTTTDAVSIRASTSKKP